MGEFVFNQMEFLRKVTLSTNKELTEQEANLVPNGFNNNILWNLGHIYLIQEQFVFSFSPELMEFPDNFPELFGMGTKPSDWTIQPPTLGELFSLLNNQPNRINERLKGRLEEEVGIPFNIPGLNLKTIGDLLSFNAYHEGIHLQAIKMLKRLVDQAHRRGLQ